MSLPIHAGTKVGELLDAYPELEEVLMSCAPEFAKLRNPVLRRTVAKIATLEQAARVAGIGARELVVKLREAAGQTVADDIFERLAADGAVPAWMREDRIRATVDADAVLGMGAHPLASVRNQLAALQPGDILLVRSSFRPQPLIDEMRRAGVDAWSIETAPGNHRTYVLACEK